MTKPLSELSFESQLQVVEKEWLTNLKLFVSYYCIIKTIFFYKEHIDLFISS